MGAGEATPAEEGAGELLGVRGGGDRAGTDGAGEPTEGAEDGVGEPSGVMASSLLIQVSDLV